MNDLGCPARFWPALLLASLSAACTAKCPALEAAHPIAAAPSPCSPTPANAPETTAVTPAQTENQPRFLLKHDANVMVQETAPHQGVGNTTAYRYFDELKGAGLMFRKRALHPGAAHGLNVLKHDEVFYVLSGRGELEIDGTKLALVPNTAVFMRLGAGIRLRQQGDEDLVIIIAYPPASSH